MKSNRSNWRTLLNRWISGEADRSDERSLEAMAKDDPFLADALEGFRSMPEADHARSVTKLKASLRSKYEKKKRGVIFYLQRVAAVGLLVVGAWFILGQFGGQEEIAEKNTAVAKDDSPAPSENIQANADSVLSFAVDEEATAPELEEIATKPAPKIQPAIAQNAQETPASPAAYAPAPPVEMEISDDIAIAEEPVIDGIAIAEKKKPAADEPIGFSSDTKDVAVAKTEAKSYSDESFMLKAPDEKARAGNMAMLEQVIQGKITDKDGYPLIGVNVLLDNTQQGTVTDIDGNFTLESPIENPALVISYTGYQTQTVQADAFDFLQVQLENNDQSLDEVVVTQLSGKAKRSTAAQPTFEPKGGFKKFEKYIRQNLQYPQASKENGTKGQVTIGFKIDASGNPVDFQVLQSLGSEYDEEAKRLLREGPKWIGPANTQTSYSFEF